MTTLYLGETWPFGGTIDVPQGETLQAVALRLSGGGVTIDATVSLDLPAAWSAAITPAQQASAGARAGSWSYEVRATFVSGLVDTQAAGSVYVHQSLFS